MAVLWGLPGVLHCRRSWPLALAWWPYTPRLYVTASVLPPAAGRLFCPPPPTVFLPHTLS
eukprot:360049-Chlamydomonas_euryale.AAC.4